jgi:hypothetical protein
VSSTPTSRERSRNRLASGDNDPRHHTSTRLLTDLDPVTLTLDTVQGILREVRSGPDRSA